MKKDFYNDPDMMLNVDWRIITLPLFGTITLEDITIECRGQTEYIVQSKIDGGWQDEYFSCMNGERIPDIYQWELEQKSTDINLSTEMLHVIDMATD